jgi:hypothetical protein
LPVTWPFLGAVGSGLTPTTPAAPQIAQTSPLLLAQAQRAAAQRRRYPKKKQKTIKTLQKTNLKQLIYAFYVSVCIRILKKLLTLSSNDV